jgi:hypothetical protein
MTKKFEKWQKTIDKYYRKHLKGELISPWHHYQLQILEREMQELSPEIYKKEFA